MSDVHPGQSIVVWFSCGAASAVAAYETIRLYGTTNPIRVVNNPIREEHPDNRRFLHDVSRWLGVEIESATNPRYPEGSCQAVWERRRFMSGPAGAPCTAELKKRARRQWEDDNPGAWDWIVLGFTADERKRHDQFVDRERANLLPVLIDAGIDKAACFRRLLAAGIELPAMYRMGFPNANCVGCVKATSPTYWNAVRDHFPDVFRQRAATSREIGARLVRVGGSRKFLDELSPDARGRPLRSSLADVECGIFCQERFPWDGDPGADAVSEQRAPADDSQRDIAPEEVNEPGAVDLWNAEGTEGVPMPPSPGGEE